MTDSDKLRIKVAELLGWTEIEFLTIEATTGYSPTQRVCLGVLDQNSPYKDSVPDYPNDLNAIHEAERKLLTTVDLQAKYIRHVKNLSWDINFTMADGWGTFATAQQKAEALVLTFSNAQE